MKSVVKEVSHLFRHMVDRFTNVPLAGLDLGSAFIKVVEIESRAEGPVVTHALIRPVQEGPGRPAIKPLLKEAGINTHRVAVGLASPEVIARPFHFPSMTPKELKQAVALEAEQAVLNGHSLEEVAIDWHLLSPDREETHGILAVAPKDLIASHLRTIREEGVRPRIVDIEGLALWNAYWSLAGSKQAGPKTVFLINIGARTTNLVIAKVPDRLMLVRDVQIGSQGLNNGCFDAWITELRDSMGYARSKAGLRRIDQVCLTGGGSRAEVAQQIQFLFQAPVEIWNPLDHIKHEPGGLNLGPYPGNFLTVAVGLALRTSA